MAIADADEWAGDGGGGKSAGGRGIGDGGGREGEVWEAVKFCKNASLAKLNLDLHKFSKTKN